MPVTMKMILLLLLLGGSWAQELNTTTSASEWSPFSSVSNISEAQMTSNHTAMRVPEKNDNTGPQMGTPSYTANEVSSPETSTAASSGLPVPEPTISQEISTTESSALQEVSTAPSHLTIPAVDTQGLHTMDATMANSSLGTFSGTHGLPATTATSSLETTNGSSGPAVPVTTRPLEASSGTSGPPVTMTSSSLGTLDGTSAPSITMATSTLETSKGTSGPPVVMTSFQKTTKGVSDTPISRVKLSTISTPETSINTGSRLTPNSGRGTNNTLLVAVFVALLVVAILLVLLLLWRQRQKRRTGALTLSRGGKRNGVVDAWAGPAQVFDEEAVIRSAGASGGDKGSGVPEGEGSGRRPTLTTFFGRRKSGQGSLALEELTAGSAPSKQEEEEPLVGSEDGATDTPTSDAPAAGNVEVL